MARVRAPATIANLGPGFDALGLSLGLWLEVEAAPAPDDGFAYEGEGRVSGPSTLVHEGYRAALAELGLPAGCLDVSARNHIPLARGLGSSSAALVAGAAAADVLHGGRLGRDGVLRVAARLEGHPDNVAPAVVGGFAASAMTDAGPVTAAFAWPAGWRLLVAVPDAELLTSDARAALPELVGRADAVFNLARSALWVAAVARERADWLAEACRDRLHQDARARLVPGLAEAVGGALAVGAAACFLAGAGPSVAAVVARPERLAAVRAALVAFAPRVLELAVAGGYEAEVVSAPEAEVVSAPEAAVARGG